MMLVIRPPTRLGDHLDGVVLVEGVGGLGVADGDGDDGAGVHDRAPGTGVAGVAVAGALALVVEGILALLGGGVATLSLGPDAIGGTLGDLDDDGEDEGLGLGGVAGGDGVLGRGSDADGGAADHTVGVVSGERL